MTFNTGYQEGLLVYAGPSPNNIVKNVTDFLSIELKRKIDYVGQFWIKTQIVESQSKSRR